MFTFPLDQNRSLRLFEERDVDELYAVIDANRAQLAQWLPWASKETHDEALEFIRRSGRQFADNEGF